MTYVVLAPAKTFSGVEVVVDLVTDDIESAKKTARQIKQRHESKGYKSWAAKVKIVSPKTPDAFIELADQIAKRGHELDAASGGNSFQGQSLIDWANTLRKRADELANPYNEN